MKHNIKHLPLFFFGSSPVTALLFALTLLFGQHVQASSLSLDQDFNSPFFAVPVLGARAVLLPDGKYVMFANLDTLADQSTGPIMRFNSDGTLDTTFSFSRDYSGVFAVAPMANGQLIVSATKTVHGVSSTLHQVYDILRLNADGSIDSTFGPAQSTDGGEVRIITVNGDGTIFVAGRFTAFNGQPSYGIVHLLQNGTLDPAFAPVTMTCSANTFASDGLCGVWAAPAVDGDGKIIIAGDFVSVDGVNALCIARLNPDGTVDSTFNASGFATAQFPNSPRPIRGIVIQSDGKIVIGGRLRVQANNFASILPLVRLNTDGSADQSYGAFGFSPPPDGWFFVRNLIIQPDDKVIAISRSVWRFNSTDGSHDPTFYNPALLIQRQFDTDQSTAEAFNIAVTDDGGFFIGGVFTDIDDATGPPTAERWGAAKLHSDGTLDTNFTPSHREGFKIEPGIFTRETDGSTPIAFNSLGFDTLYPAIPHNLGRLLLGWLVALGPGQLSVLFNNEPLDATGLTISKWGGIPTFKLAEATLIRDASVGLPSGQQACQLAGVDVLGTDQLAREPALEEFLRDNGMLNRTPLFYYLLREAEVAGRSAPGKLPGTRLGPLGSRIVAEVILGLLNADQDSYVHAAWEPPVIAGDSPDAEMRIDSLKKLMFYAKDYKGQRQ
jgi:uncharacterized delta-60 repeat protein